MNRLTKQDAYWMGEEFWTSAEEPDDDEIDKVYMRLKAYEDTGLMPEEVEKMRDEHRWIPVTERLPEDDDMRFYMCIVQNHEDDTPMFCQYHETYGFGFWTDVYDSVSLGFLDTEFSNMNELGYEEVIAWQPLPEPYIPAPEQDKPSGWQEQMMGAFLGDSRL